MSAGQVRYDFFATPVPTSFFLSELFWIFAIGNKDFGSRIIRVNIY
jgi:hypothetical protein